MAKRFESIHKRLMRIGVSACFFHADPLRPIFKGKTLMYVEQSLVHWVMSQGNVLASMIPLPPPNSSIGLGHYADDLDGLVLGGGSDLAPGSYGETPLRPEWAGDAIRDEYEIALYREFLAQGKPVLGVCRGAQLINVAQGGTLYQDIATQVSGAPVHRDWEIYDQLYHTIKIEPGSALARLYPEIKSARVNSIHHQGIKDLGKGLLVEARSESSMGNLVEAIRLQPSQTDTSYVVGVQWHPEFHDSNLPQASRPLDAGPILKDFFEAIKRSKL